MKWLPRGSIGIAGDDTIIIAYLLGEATTTCWSDCLLNWGFQLSHKTVIFLDTANKQYSAKAVSLFTVSGHLFTTLFVTFQIPTGGFVSSRCSLPVPLSHTQVAFRRSEKR
jgi:hypothetical protein